MNCSSPSLIAKWAFIAYCKMIDVGLLNTVIIVKTDLLFTLNRTGPIGQNKPTEQSRPKTTQKHMTVMC